MPPSTAFTQYPVASGVSVHYHPTDMHKIALLFPLVMLLPGAGHAVICKTVAADGTISYADLPPEACPKPLKLPEYTPYSPRTPAGRTPRRDGSAAPQQPGKDNFSGYTSLRFDQPSPGETIRNNTGNVPVSLRLQPGLQAGHRVRVKLDGLFVEGSYSGTSLQLTNVDRGTHSLNATVFDERGRALISASSGPFTLRKPSLNDPKRQDDNDTSSASNPSSGGDNAGQGQSSQPGSGGVSSTPGRTNPAYTPSGGGISSTPGRTNPAFSPN